MIFSSVARWVVMGSLAIIATADLVIAEDDIRRLAGTYKGYVVGDRGVRSDNLTLVIKEDGSFTATSPHVGASANSGRISLGADGQINYTSLRSAGIVAVVGDTLRFDGSGSRVGVDYSEWERT